MKQPQRDTVGSTSTTRKTQGWSIQGSGPLYSQVNEIIALDVI